MHDSITSLTYIICGIGIFSISVPGIDALLRTAFQSFSRCAIPGLNILDKIPTRWPICGIRGNGRWSLQACHWMNASQPSRARKYSGRSFALRRVVSPINFVGLILQTLRKVCKVRYRLLLEYNHAGYNFENGSRPEYQ